MRYYFPSSEDAWLFAQNMSVGVEIIDYGVDYDARLVNPYYVEVGEWKFDRHLFELLSEE